MAIADPPIPFDEFSQHLARMGEALEQADWTELWKEELKAIVLEGQAENFVMQTDPSGQPWQLRRYHGDPIRDRGRSGIPGHPVLTDLGDLFDSIVNEGASNHVEEAIKNEFKTGTNIEYAWEHEYGQGQAERPFIGIREEFIDRLEAAVADHAQALIAGV